MFLYMQTTPGGDDYNCRGELAAGDDAATFAQRMGRHGLAVVTTKVFAGKSTILAVLTSMGGQVVDAPLTIPAHAPAPVSAVTRGSKKKGA